MSVTQMPFVLEFIRMCDDAWRLGWHEYHGGNLSYRMRHDETESVREALSGNSSAEKRLEMSFPELAGESFLVTGSGECFRNAKTRPADNFGIVRLNEAGNAYQVLWGLEANGGKPTSEFLSHLQIHRIKKETAGDAYHVVYHCHPANIIALTFLLPADSALFTRALWDMEPECPMTFPDGIGLVDWMVPGTAPLAKKTGELMESHDIVIWSQHGILVAAKDFDTALGVAHTVEKAAEILIKVMSVSPVRKSVSDDQYAQLADVFQLDMRKEYLQQ